MMKNINLWKKTSYQEIARWCHGNINGPNGIMDASATDVKVFHLILSADRLLSQSVIIIAIIIVQGTDEDKK